MFKKEITMKFSDKNNAIELLFLGTCACEFGERLKTDLKCKFDKDVRRSSAMLIDGRFLVDCGVHTEESLAIAGVDVLGITDVFVTHLHMDHYNPDSIQSLARGRSEPLRLWVREGAEVPELENVRVMHMTLFEEYPIDGGSVVSIPANHDPKAHPQHYIFDIGGKRIFYGCDGAWFVNESFIFMRKMNLSAAVLDCTVGDYVGDFRLGEHNSIPMLRLMLPSMMNVGMISKDTKIIFSHLAPSLHKSHEETERIAEGLGATVAYDGMRVSI